MIGQLKHDNNSVVTRVLDNLEKRRQNILNGDINTIPTPFRRFSNDFIGLEQKRYILVTSYTKVGKTNFASYLFLYNTILYAYNNPDKVRVKIFYYPLEETPEDVTLRFMSFLLYYLSGYKIIVSRDDLNSSKNVAVSKELLDLFKSEKYKSILDFWEKSIIFSDSTNASGVWFECQRYAKEHGRIFRDKIKYKDEFGIEHDGERFNHYEPDDPKEYKIIFYDHLALTSPERGMDLRQTMNKLSEYFVLLRNRYNFTAIAIQQQAITDNLDAFKSNKLRPTIANLGDAKTVARDCDLCIGLFSPYIYEIPEYLGYNVTKLKNNLRFAEILINRHGQSNGIIGLLFIGQCNYWKELPKAKDSTEMDKVYNYLDTINNNSSKYRTLLIHNSITNNKRNKNLLHRLFKLNIFARTNKNNN